MNVALFITKKCVCLTDGTSKSECNQLLSYPGLPTPLQVFTQQGGLALLAQHLPLVYPETLRYSTLDKVSTPDALDGDWVKVDASDDIYEVNVCFIIVSKSRNIVDLWKLQSESLT
jgi:hypothetical protein